jgi:hypothetical protein
VLVATVGEIKKQTERSPPLSVGSRSRPSARRHRQRDQEADRVEGRPQARVDGREPGHDLRVIRHVLVDEVQQLNNRREVNAHSSLP